MKECRNHVNLQPLTESQKASHWQTKQTLPRESKSQEEKPSPLAVEQSFLRDAWDSTFRSVTEEGGISQPELNIPLFSNQALQSWPIFVNQFLLINDQQIHTFPS